MKRIHLCCLFLFTVTLTLGAGAQSPGRQVLRGHVPAAVSRLVPIGDLAASKHLHLAIGLPLRNQAALDALIQELYDPASPRYRQYLTPEEFAARFGPTQEDYQAVIAFAKANGLTVTATYPNRVLLGVNGSVAAIEKAFHVRLRVYPHPTEDRTFYAPDTEPSLNLSVAVADISGLNDYARPRPNLKPLPHEQPGTVKANAGSGPSGTYWGNDFRAAYAPSVALTGSGQIIGLLEFDGYYGVDITNYLSQSGLPNVALENVLLDSVSGTPGYSGIANAVAEVSLDIELAIAMAPGVSKVIVYEGDLHNSILNSMVTNTLVKQFSSSWSWSGGPSTTTDNILKQFAAQGQSYFQASGDNGAYDSTIDDVGSITMPVDSTNVTSVGATSLTTSGSGGAWVSETNWNAGGGMASGGGFSVYYNLPSWQQGINMTTNHGSTTKRNLPDVAMVGDQIWVIHDNGSSGPFGGTSCAAPLWAGFAALANQMAENNSRPSIGFINPAIYAIGKGASYSANFHDITIGNNYNSGSPAEFDAVPGFDLCTGWGSPTGINLLVALATPDSLGVLPGAGFNATGTYGGPFTPNSQVFSLTNSGGTSLTWSLINPASWLTPSSTGGTLAPGASANVTVSLNSMANVLASGAYSANVIFSNLTSAVAHYRQFNLTVSPLELSSNGGFETGDFTGWSLTGDTSYSEVTGNISFGGVNVYTHGGSFMALLGTFGSAGNLSQTLTTSPGQGYLLSFWLNGVDGSTPNSFQVNWNGGSITNFSDLGQFPGDGWTNLQFLVGATGTNTVLQFSYQNDIGYFALDDVSLQPLPPPVFQSASAAGGTLSFSWNAVPGLHYQVQYKTNLSQLSWLNLNGTIPATNSTVTASDTIGPERQKFYRLTVVP
jgi:subtilase family serine protease